LVPPPPSMTDIDYKTAPGWLTEKERQLLYDISKSIEKPFPSILNIGVEFGASLICFLSPRGDVSVFGIDIDTSKWKYLVPNVQLIQCDSDSEYEWWARYVDVLFVDGGHSYQQTLNDLRYTRHLKKGGILAVHDCYSWENPGVVRENAPEVNAALEDFLRDSPYEFEEMPYVDSIRWFRLKYKGRIFGKGAKKEND